MKKTLTAACAAVMFVTSFGAGALPAAAAPIAMPKVEAGSSDVLLVQRRNDRRDRFERRRDGNYYYNGHRGFRERRSGYRRHNGYWFPPAAFIAGAIIGGTIGNPPRAAVRLSDRHIRWCANQYRSYRASDNTFNPNVGPRRICRSPFG